MKKLINILTLLLLFSATWSFAQPELDWVTVASPNAIGPDQITDVFVDGEGNTYACGNYTGTMTFGGTILNALLSNEVFIIKYDVNGTVEWVVTSSGNGTAEAHAIYLDSADNIYVAGSFTHTVLNFGSTSISRNGTKDMFVLKMDNNGNPLHLIGPDLTSSFHSEAMAITGNGDNVFVAGYTRNGPMVIDGQSTGMHYGQDDVFFCSIDSTLSTVNWLQAHGGMGKDLAHGIDIEGSTLVASGCYGNGGATFFTSGPDYSLPDFGTRSVFVTKLDISSGELDWVNWAGSSSGQATANDLVLQGGQIFITGSFNNDFTFNANPTITGPYFYNDTVSSNGGQDIFVAKFDYNGDYVISWTEGGTGNDFATSIDLELTCYQFQIAGQFENTVNFGGASNLTADGKDLFVASYDNFGNFNWVYKETSSGDEIVNGLSSYNGRVSMGGSITFNTTFGTDPSTTVLTATNDHFTSSFICPELMPCGPTITCLADSTVEVDASCSYILDDFTLTTPVDDGCANGYSFEQTPAAGTSLAVGIYEIQLVAIDYFGFSDTCTFNLIVESFEDPTFTYATYSYCAYDADPTPDFIAQAGGTFSENSGDLMLNASNGTIDLSGSLPGTYNVVYTTNGPCPASDSVQIVLKAEDDASFSYSGTTFCSGNGSDQEPVFEAIPGGSYTASPGGLDLDSGDGEIEIEDSEVGNYTIYYTTSGACPSTDSVQFNIIPEDDPSFEYSQSLYCNYDPDPAAVNVETPGGTFTAPSQIVFLNASTGLIDLDASTVGGPYTITYTTPGPDCPNSSTFNITISTTDDASFTYANTVFCNNASNEDTVSVGTTGGTFSTNSPNLIVDAISGQINVSGSQPGTYQIYYSTSGFCPAIDSVEVTINPNEDASFAYGNTVFCINESNEDTLSVGTNGGTFTTSSPNLIVDAISGQINVSGSQPGTYQIYYSTSGPCPAIDSVEVTINAEDDASFTYVNTVFCNNASNEDTESVGTTGGTFTTSSPNLIVDAISGQINVSGSQPGTYQIYYSTAGSCPAIDSVEVTINLNEDASFAYGNTVFCINESNEDTLSVGTTGGTFSTSSPNLIVDAISGQINVSGSLPGTYQIYYSTSGPCPAIDSVEVTINAEDDASFAYANTVFCNNVSNEDTLSVATSGGTFSTSSPNLIVNAISGQINVSGSQPGNYQIYYTTAGACSTIDSVQVIIHPSADATFSYASPFCKSDENPLPTVEEAGGFFESNDLGLIIDATTGEINLSESMSGIDMEITHIIAGACADTATTKISIYEVPTANAGIDQEISNETETTLSAVEPIEGSGQWQIVEGQGTIIDPSDPGSGLIDLQSGEITLEWTVENGPCPVAKDQVTIQVSSLWIPNVLTPNGDGDNDTFEIIGIENQANKVQIFNRWGQLIYEYENYQNDWDGTSDSGTQLEDDTYFYIITIEGIDQVFKGFIVLKR